MSNHPMHSVYQNSYSHMGFATKLEQLKSNASVLTHMQELPSKKWTETKSDYVNDQAHSCKWSEWVVILYHKVFFWRSLHRKGDFLPTSQPTHLWEAHIIVKYLKRGNVTLKKLKWFWCSNKNCFAFSYRSIWKFSLCSLYARLTSRIKRGWWQCVIYSWF